MKNKRIGRLVGIMSMTLTLALGLGILIGNGNVKSNASCAEQASEVVEVIADDSQMKEELNTEILKVEDIQDTSSYESILEQLLNNDEIDEVCVIDNSLMKNEDVKRIDDMPISSVRGQASVKIYDIENGKDYCSNTAAAVVIGEPDINISISETKNVERTYSFLSKNVNVGITAVNDALGDDVSSSDSIRISGSYKVPQKHNNKKIKNVKLTAHILFREKTFKIKKLQHPGGRMFTNLSGKAIWAHGTGYSRKPYGVKFKKTYIYKK